MYFGVQCYKILDYFDQLLFILIQFDLIWSKSGSCYPNGKFFDSLKLFFLSGFRMSRLWQCFWCPRRQNSPTTFLWPHFLSFMFVKITAKYSKFDWDWVWIRSFCQHVHSVPIWSPTYNFRYTSQFYILSM